MNKKLLYSAPEAELLFIKFEDNFCQTGYGDPGTAGGPVPYAPGDGDDLD